MSLPDLKGPKLEVFDQDGNHWHVVRLELALVWLRQGLAVRRRSGRGATSRRSVQLCVHQAVLNGGTQRERTILPHQIKGKSTCVKEWLADDAGELIGRFTYKHVGNYGFARIAKT